MKIIEINSEQWEIKESGIVTAVAGALIAVSGTVALGWVLSHLEWINRILSLYPSRNLTPTGRIGGDRN